MKNLIVISVFFLGFAMYYAAFSWAQSTVSYKIQAIFIYNFAKYIEWKNENKFKEFKIGVLCSDSSGLSISQILKELAKNKNIHGLPLQVINFKSIEEISDVQILYVNKKGNYNIRDVLNKIETFNTLLVTAPSEIEPNKYEGYSCENSMINFIIKNNKCEFEMNQNRIREHELTINTSLTSLAINICNAFNFVPPTQEEKEAAFIDWKKEFEDLQHEFSQTKEKMEVLSTEKIKSLKEIEKLNTANQLKELKLRVQQDEFNQKLITKKIELSNRQHESEQKQMAIERKEKENELLKKEQLLKNAEISRQKIFIGFTIFGLLLAIAVAWFIFSRFRITQRQKKIIEEQKEKIVETHHNTMESINYAQLIQQAMLTSEEYMNESLGEYFKVFLPRDVVSGDFYWCYKMEEGSVTLATCDCTGHGVPGAFLSMLFNSLLDETVIEQRLSEPGVILNRLREGVVKKIGQKGERKEGMDCALFLIDRKELKIKYAGANNPCYIVSADGSAQLLLPDDMPIGYEDGKMERSFIMKEAAMSAGSMVYAFTDGYRDQFGGLKNKKFSRKRFLDLLSLVASKPVSEQKATIEKTFNDWKGIGEQTDDVTVIGIRI